MSSHPDADAFIRAILNNPAEVTTRLAFADWLEETGDPPNVAWAHFIRLMAEADHLPPDGERRRELERQLAEMDLQVRATLTVDVGRLINHAEHFWRLLPKPNITVRLAGHEIPRAVLELIPESVARENDVLPIDLRGNCLTVVTTDPVNYDTLQKLAFILNKDITPLRADAEEIRSVISRSYGQTETESVDSILVEFVDTAHGAGHSYAWQATDDADTPVVRLVNLIFTEALDIGATGIRLLPTAEGVAVQYRVRGTWLNRDALPARLWQAIATRIAIMAGIPIDDVIEQRFTIAGTIPLRVANTACTLRVSTGEHVDGLFIEIERQATAPSPA